MAVICQQLYQRYVRGESTDERMASRGDNVGMLANRARRILAEQGGQLMDIDLSGKVALVTGGSRGLGSGDGARLRRVTAPMSSSPAAASRPARKSPRRCVRRRVGGRCRSPVMSGVGTTCERLTEAAYDEFGHVDVLVNNAGMAPVYPSLVEASEELFDKVVAVNLKGPFRLSALVGARMVAGDGGSMINISSIAAQRPQVHDIPYAAAKAGLNTMTLGLADGTRTEGAGELRDGRPVPHRHLQGVGRRELPGVRQASATRSARLGEPHEIVGTALYLASDLSSFTTGTVLTVDGGVSVSSPFPAED